MSDPRSYGDVHLSTFIVLYRAGKAVEREYKMMKQSREGKRESERERERIRGRESKRKREKERERERVRVRVRERERESYRGYHRSIGV